MLSHVARLITIGTIAPSTSCAAGHTAWGNQDVCIQDTLSSRALGLAAFRQSAHASCMQDSFARARTRPKAARPSARATIGYLVYNLCSRAHSARPSACATIGYLVYKTILYLVYKHRS